MKVNDFSKKWLKDIVEKVKMIEIATFEDMAVAYRQKVKKIVMAFDLESSAPVAEEVQELRSKIAQFENDTAEFKKVNESLKSEKEKLAEEYAQIVRGKIPDLDKLKEGVIGKVAATEKAKLERDNELMFKEIERRTDKVRVYLGKGLMYGIDHQAPEGVGKREGEVHQARPC